MTSETRTETTDTAKALDTAAANVLLTFHDWPHYTSPAARAEQQKALGMLADALEDHRAALSAGEGAR